MPHPQVDPYAAEPKNRHLFELLQFLLQAQEESISTIRESENEVCLLYCMKLFVVLVGFCAQFDTHINLLLVYQFVAPAVTSYR